MTVRGRRGLLLRTDRRLLAAGAASVAAVLALLLPWLSADPPAGLTWSNSPYTDEGLFNSAARDLVVFGSFGHAGLYRELTNSGYVLVNAVLFSLTGPSLVAARVLSVLSVAAMVVLVLLGLSGLVGFAAATAAGAGIGGSQLMLLYGHIGIVEPFEAAMLVGAFVALIRGVAGRRWSLGILAGLLLAVAAGAKESALLAFPAILGVPLVASLVTGAWRRLIVALAAAATFLVCAGVWAVAVAGPNRAELDAAMKTFGGALSWSAYPHTPRAMAHALTHWLAHGRDHVLTWNIPLLAAAGAGLICCALLWRRVRPAHLYVAVTGVVWAAVCWAVTVLSGYNPNRYFIVAIPGLALAAGPGLGLAVEWAAGHLRHRAWEPVGAAIVALLIAVPGVAGYLHMESGVAGTDQLLADQAAMAKVLPRNAVLFGLYAPDMAFPHRIRTVIPWPQSGLHMDDPVQRYGVNYVIVDVGPGRSSTDVATLEAVIAPGRRLGSPVITLTWGPHKLAVYRVGPPAGAAG